MIDQIKAFTKIAFKSSLKWFTVVGIGGVFSIVTFITAYYLLNNSEIGGSGLFANLSTYLTKEFLKTLLFLISLPFILVYVLVANKIALHQAVFAVWGQKINGFVASRIAGLIEKMINTQPDWIKNMTDTAALKIRLIDANKKDNTASKLQKRILNYGLNKANLEGIDLQGENMNLPDVIATKINDTITDLAQPSFKLF